MDASEPAAHALEIPPHRRAGARGAGRIQRDAGAVEDVRRHADALLADALVIRVKTVVIHAPHFLRELDVPPVQAAAIAHRVGSRPRIAPPRRRRRPRLVSEASAATAPSWMRSSAPTPARRLRWTIGESTPSAPAHACSRQRCSSRCRPGWCSRESSAAGVGIRIECVAALPPGSSSVASCCAPARRAAVDERFRA